MSDFINGMETAKRHTVRGLCLRLAEAAGGIGAGDVFLKAAVRKEGVDAAKADIEEAVRYLEGKGLVTAEEIKNPALGVTRRIAWITPAGIDVLEGTSPAEGVSL